MEPADDTFRPGVSIDEAASTLGVSPSTARRWVKEGRLPSSRVETPQGHAYRVHLPPAGSETPSMAGATEPAAIASMERAEAMAAYTRSLLEPLVARLAEQEAIIREQAETIGGLRARLAAFSTASVEKEPEPAPVPEPLTPQPNGQGGEFLRRNNPAPWWARWWGWLNGA